jgi:SAM-dependent methyltransferase
VSPRREKAAVGYIPLLMEANAAENARWNDDAWTKEWPKREVLTNSVTPVLLEALQLRPGQRLLDVGCGGGKATMAACRQVQPGGSAVGVDISGALLALAAERALGVTAISWQQTDMQTGTVPGGPFDTVMSQFGVMFFDEPVTAFANIRRHVARGGRLGFACWQALDRNPWFPGPAVAPYVAAPAPPAAGKSPTGPFALGDPDRVRRILTEAGFESVDLDLRSHEVEAPDTAISDDARLALMGVTPGDMDDARRAVASMIEPFRLADGRYRFPLAYQIVTAVPAG